MKKIASMHTWLIADGKILDFSADQFNAFCNEKFDQVHITNIGDSRYLSWQDFQDQGYNEYGYDEDWILNYYIENL